MLLFTFTGLMYWIRDCFFAFFSGMEALKNGPAIMLIVIGFIGMIGWLIQQARYNSDADRNGTIK